MYDQFAPLLERALTEPGIISAAYRRFHRFSIGNQILAAIQLHDRGLRTAAGEVGTATLQGQPGDPRRRQAQGRPAVTQSVRYLTPRGVPSSRKGRVPSRFSIWRHPR